MKHRGGRTNPKEWFSHLFWILRGVLKSLQKEKEEKRVSEKTTHPLYTIVQTFSKT